MSSLFDLTGKVALITGSSRGIGFSLARGLAQAGASIVINARSNQAADDAAHQLRQEGHQAQALAFDVTEPTEVLSAFEKLDAQNISVDILINNAGIQHRQTLLELQLADWQRVIDTNLTSAFLVSQQAAKRMIDRQTGGKIINIGSLTSEAARATVAPYTTSKGGIKMLTKAMAAEWAVHQIQANAIGPGYFATDMNQALVDNAEFDQWVKKSNPSARWGRPEELVGTAIFLSSEASAYVNGQIIYVDGGWLSIL